MARVYTLVSNTEASCRPSKRWSNYYAFVITGVQKVYINTGIVATITFVQLATMWQFIDAGRRLVVGCNPVDAGNNQSLNINY